MIQLIYMHLFYGRRRLVYIGFYALMIISIIFFGYVNEPKYVQILDRVYYQEYFNLTMKTFLPMIFSIFMLMLVMDHDQKAFHMIESYHSRFFVYSYKFISYVTITAFSLILLYLFMIGFMTLLTPYYDLNMDLCHLFIHLYLDSIILISCFMILIKKEHLNRGFIVILIFLIYPMITESMNSKIMFYILPIYTLEIQANWLVYAYKICYICSGFLLGLLINERKQIYG